MSVKQAIASNLQRYRKQRKMGQAAIAKKLGVSRATYSSWENAHTVPPSDKLIIAARMFGVRVADIFDDDPEGNELRFLPFTCRG